MSGIYRLTLPIEGYDTEVIIPVGRIVQEIKNAEEQAPDSINRYGINGTVDLSKFVSVECSPTDDKWDELAGVVVEQ